jgi:hypothetical protein
MEIESGRYIRTAFCRHRNQQRRLRPGEERAWSQKRTYPPLPVSGNALQGCLCTAIEVPVPLFGLQGPKHMITQKSHVAQPPPPLLPLESPGPPTRHQTSPVTKANDDSLALWRTRHGGFSSTCITPGSNPKYPGRETQGGDNAGVGKGGRRGCF